MIELINKQEFEILNLNTKKFDKLKLSEEQELLINNILENDNVVVKKLRRQGVTTAIQALFSTMLMYNTNTKIAIMTCDCRNGNYMFDNIKRFIIKSKNQLVIDKITNRQIRLANGSYIKLINSEYDVSLLKGENIWFLFDEIAYSINSGKLYKYINETIQSPKFIVTSTQNGMDSLLFPLWLIGDDIGYKKLEFNCVNSIMNDNLSEYVKKLSEKHYDSQFSGKFIINDDKIVDNKLEEQRKSFNLNFGTNIKIAELKLFLESEQVKIINKSTYKDLEDGFVDYRNKIGL